MAKQIVLNLPDKEEDVVFDSYEDLNPIWQLLEQYDKARVSIVDKPKESATDSSSGVKVQENDKGGNKTMDKKNVIEILKKNADIEGLYDKALQDVSDILDKGDEEAVMDLLGASDLDSTFLKDQDTFVDRMAQDAIDAGLTEEELKVYPEEWLSWLKRL